MLKFYRAQGDSIMTMTDFPYFNVADPRFSITSEAVYEARERSWYARTNYGLAVLRYEEVSRLLRHPKLRQGSVNWMAHNGITAGPLARWWASWILHKEGSEHRRLRKVLTPAFAPQLVNDLQPRFRALAEGLIDSFADSGRCDFVQDFASPYSAQVFAVVLGTPVQDWSQLAQWADTIGLSLGVTVKQELPRIEQALQSLFEYADGLIAERRSSRFDDADDFLSALVRAQDDDGLPLPEQELRDIVVLLIFAGYDTTRNQLGLAMQTFLQYPQQWQLLAERPELGRAAVEEVMRINPTTRWVTRVASETFEFQNVVIDEGTTLHMFTQSAGTDPAVTDPALPTFDITAERRGHFGFGAGVHYCMGHLVARLDMAEALIALARRLRNPRPDGPGVWLPDSGNTGPLKLPIAFETTP
jgi:cytochrome P450